ncbi:AT-rich interactive domain-containing protein 1B-like isoform X1 [Anopheles albimanus]|uniref:AT-rich interactive domain-containing protein 1B-like isoform X1 n=1 Tax=Anopheles albimanus TaxID=7167 RepID=UPI001641AA05|nr:AT-rich interactive domain-containing protein 1B-like isoform X1 [Anopheles albimanus]
MKLVFTEVGCALRLLLLLLVAGGEGVLGEAALGNYYKEVVREQHEAINEMNQNFTELERASEKLIDLGYHVAKHTVPPKTIKITNTVAVKVPVPFPVKVPEPVPVPVPVDKPIPIPVPTLVAVPVDATAPTAPTATATVPVQADADVAASSQRQAAHGPAVPGQEVQEYVQSFPIHSVYDAGDDYNPMEGNRLALAAEHHTASPTESTFSNPGPSSLQQYQQQHHQHHHHQQHHQQQHYRQYHTAPKGSLSAATAERAKQGSTAHHYRTGTRGSGFTGAAVAAAAAATAGQRQYHAGGEDQTAPAAAAHFGAAESNANQPAGTAEPYGTERDSAVGSYKHHTPRTPDTPYTFAAFYRASRPSSPPSAPSGTTGEAGYYRGGGGGQSDGGEFARTGGAGFGEGRGEAGNAGERYVGSFGQPDDGGHTTEVRFPGGQTTEVRFHGQNQALQAEGEGQGQGQGAEAEAEEEEEAARGGHSLGTDTNGASVQAPRPFQAVRESYPHYEKPNFADYHHEHQHQYDHHHHDHHHGSASTGGRGRGGGEFGGGIGGGEFGGIGGGAAAATGSILAEGYDHPSFGRPGGVSGGNAATTATATGAHRYPVPGGRSAHLRPALSTAGHHHTHPAHPEPGQEAHPDLRHQTVHHQHDDAATGALHGGGHPMGRFPFYQATKDDPHLTRGQLKPHPPPSAASSGGPTGATAQFGSRFRSGSAKESTAGQHHHHHHHHHHHKAASHYHTYTEHRPTGTGYTGAKLDEKYKAGGFGSGSITSVPSDHHLYPNYGTGGAEYDHGEHATAAKLQFHYHNVHPYGTGHGDNGQQQQHQQQHQSNGIGASGGGAASEHHYYHAEPEPTTFTGQLTSYDPPASGGTTYHHFHESASASDLLPGASEVHEQLAEDAVVLPSSSSYTDTM